ncbi:MAG: glycosyl hydrolase [bacterium]
MTNARRARRTGFAGLAAALALVAACGSGASSRPATDASPIPPEPGFAIERLVNPPASYGPWVRWWWPGNDVEDAELAREVDVLAAAGFAGAEIQAFDAALDPNADAAEIARRRSYATPSFYAHLAAAAAQAEARGLALDLTLGSGWPVGGEHVRPESSIATLLWSEDAVEGPGTVTLDLARPDKPIFYLVAQVLELAGEPQARWEGDRAERVAVLAYRVTGGGRASNPLDLADAIELDAGSVVDLTARVSTDGTLAWEAPAGRWQVIAFFRAPDGEYPLLVAEPGPGYVVDHLDTAVVRDELEYHLGARTGLALDGGAPFRAIFDDSLELKSERHVTADFVQEFRRRRGYDPTPWLPAVVVPGADNYVFEAAALQAGAPFRFSDDDERVRYDWSRTVSDLFVERWYGTMRSFGHARGLALRAQPYGAAFDVLRAQGAVDVPETEQLYAGGSELALAMASSAAALYGRNLVSAEAMPWAGRDFMTTPAKMKLAADKLFASGVNQVVFHGFPYRKEGGYGEAGWNPFSSPWSGLLTFASHIGETDPFFGDQPQLDRYLARCQYALRQGAPDVDLLVYYPWLGFPSNYQFTEGHDETLFTGALPDLEPRAGFDQLYRIGRLLGVSGTDPRAAWLERMWPLLEGLDARGITWAWVNDESLAVAERASDARVAIRGRTYRGVVVADAPTMDAAAAERVGALAQVSIPVLLAGEIPARQPGLRDMARGDARVGAAFARAAGGANVARSEDPAAGMAALETIGFGSPFRFARPATALRQARRALADGGEIVFFWNASREPIATAVEASDCAEPRWFDAWTGELSAAETAFGLALAPWETRFLLCGVNVDGAPVADGTLPIVVAGESRRRTALGAWQLSVSGPDVIGGSFSTELSALTDWREIPALRVSSSPGVYRTSIDRPALGEGERAVLTLGWVVGTADVRVNGGDARRLRLPPFELDVTDALVEGRNDLEITVTAPLRNRFVGYGVALDPAYAQFAGRGDAVMAAGILGPASLDVRGARP